MAKAFSDRIRQRASARGYKWHLDEVVISIAGEQHWLWRAVDQNGFVLDVLIQPRRDSRAAQRLMKKRLNPPARRCVRIPIYSGRVFRLEAGHRSDLKPATIPK